MTKLLFKNDNLILLQQTDGLELFVEELDDNIYIIKSKKRFLNDISIINELPVSSTKKSRIEEPVVEKIEETIEEPRIYKPISIIDHMKNLSELKRPDSNIAYYKASSLNKTRAQLNRLFQRAYPMLHLDDLNESHLENTKNIKHVLNECKDIPVGSRRSLGSALIILCRHNNIDESIVKIYQDIVNDLDAEDNYNRVQPRKSDEELIKLEDIKYKMDQLEKVIDINPKYNQYDLEYLLLGFYYYLFPLRQAEVCNLKWDTDEPEFNCLDSINWKITIRNHKTDKIQNRPVYNIPKEFIDILKKYKETKLKNCEWVIATLSLSRMKTDYVTKTFNKVFDGKKISTQKLRRDLSKEQHDLDPSFEHNNEYAKAIGHSLATAVRDYIKK